MMDRAQFMQELEKLLADISETERQDALECGCFIDGWICCYCGRNRPLRGADWNRSHDHRNWLSDDRVGNPYGFGADQYCNTDRT